MTLSMLVLPAPLGPINPFTPTSKLRVTPSSGFTPPNCRVSSLISSMACRLHVVGCASQGVPGPGRCRCGGARVAILGAFCRGAHPPESLDEVLELTGHPARRGDDRMDEADTEDHEHE